MIINLFDNNYVENDIIFKILDDPINNLLELDESKSTILMYACDKGYIQICKLYLQNYQENINMCDESGYTALHSAICNKYIDIIKLLIKYEVDTNVSNNTSSPLIFAIIINNIEICKLLLKEDTNINLRIHDNNFALLQAVKNNNIEIIKLLFINGAIDIDNECIKYCLENNKELVSILYDYFRYEIEDELINEIRIIKIKEINEIIIKILLIFEDKNFEHKYIIDRSRFDYNILYLVKKLI
jgi:hypothetical protein